MSENTYCPVVELRQYTIVPGGREVLIALFEREFIESQETTGMKIIGQFRDLNNPDRFVWLRGFSDMAARAEQLQEFYGGPIWKKYRFPLANMTRKPLASTRESTGLLVATIYHLIGGTGADFADFFARELESILSKMDAPALASFVTENHPNTFPALPVREEANVFVWFSLFATRAAYERHAAAFPEALEERGVAKKLSGLIEGQPEVLLLAPTARSLLRGKSA